MSDIDQTLVDEALKIVTGARREKYDRPERNFERIAKVWEGLTDRKFTASEVALMFVGLKIVREAFSPQRDNIVDGIGYLLCADAVTPKSEAEFDPDGLWYDPADFEPEPADECTICGAPSWGSANPKWGSGFEYEPRCHAHMHVRLLGDLRPKSDDKHYPITHDAKCAFLCSPVEPSYDLDAGTYIPASTAVGAYERQQQWQSKHTDCKCPLSMPPQPEVRCVCPEPCVIHAGCF